MSDDEDIIDIGRIDNPEPLAPIARRLYAYDASGEKEVAEVFHFRPVQPAGRTIDAVRAAAATGDVGMAGSQYMLLLDEAVMPDDKTRWEEFLHSPDIEVPAATLAELAKSLMEYWAARPTRRSIGSAGGSSPEKVSSRAAARSRASTGKKKPSTSS